MQGFYNIYIDARKHVMRAIPNTHTENQHFR